MKLCRTQGTEYSSTLTQNHHYNSIQARNNPYSCLLQWKYWDYRTSCEGSSTQQVCVSFNKVTNVYQTGGILSTH